MNHSWTETLNLARLTQYEGRGSLAQEREIMTNSEEAKNDMVDNRKLMKFYRIIQRKRSLPEIQESPHA